ARRDGVAALLRAPARHGGARRGSRPARRRRLAPPDLSGRPRPRRGTGAPDDERAPPSFSVLSGERSAEFDDESAASEAGVTVTSTLFDLTGRTAVVVGGTTGIGHALALGLAEAGADVVASSRRPEQVEQTAAQIEAKGRKTLRLTSDVHDRTTLESLRDAVLGAFGKGDI